MIALSIVSVLISVIYPMYEKEILRSRFEKTKVIIQKIAFAQERYKVEQGSYYLSGSFVQNENKIAEDLDVNLTNSNNFLYSIYPVVDGSYKILVTLRYGNICPDSSIGVLACKQEGTADADDWVDKYDTNLLQHYIAFIYPGTFLDKTHYDYSAMMEE